jgi:hypothetical protein
MLVILAILALTSVAANGGRRFNVRMTGAAEAPGPGDPDGSGRAKLGLFLGHGEVCFLLKVSKIALPATAAHIHKAPAGSPGPVVVGLTAPNAKGLSVGCVAADRQLIKDIIQNPEEYYVNVHNADFPAGAVRGQLSK